MKRLIACTALCIGLVLPAVSQAHGDRRDDYRRDDRYAYQDRGRDGRNDRRDGDRYDNRGRHHHNDPIRVIGSVIALPFIVVGAVVETAVTVVAAPFRLHDSYVRANADYYDDDAPRYGQVLPRQQPAPQGYYGEPAPQYYDPYYAPQPQYRGY